MESANADGNAVYDTIGVGYSAVRRSDPRIGHQLHRGLGDASTILNVGAGTGSYEPADRDVIAVEPSMEMISQRSNSHARCVRGVAERLPFPAGSFDAAMAILTVHHWSDPVSGLHELRRVTSGPIIVLTFDAHVHNQQWFTTEYLPEIITMDTHLPTPDVIADILGGASIEILPVPFDCTDGFGHAWWRRPEAYLDPSVRAGISGIARLDASIVDPAMLRLRDDLDSGRWHNAHADLLTLDAIDAGYRIVIVD
jgi:SAM-dependent methyltransferase